MEIHLNMYQTLAVAVLVLLFGSFLRHRIGFLENSVFRHLSLAVFCLQF